MKIMFKCHAYNVQSSILESVLAYFSSFSVFDVLSAHWILYNREQLRG